MEFKSLAGITNICRPVMLSRQNIVLFANGSCIQSICLNTGNLLGSYDEHQDLVTCILYDEDCEIDLKNTIIPANEKRNVVISASLDGDVRVWNLTTCTTYLQSRLSDPVFKLKLIPSHELIDPASLKESQSSSNSSFDLLVTTAQPRLDSNDSGNGSGKMKVQYEVNAYDLETLTKNDHLTTITMHHHNMEYISVNVAANRHGVQQLVTAIVYVRNKKLMFRLLLSGGESKKPAQVDIGQDILCLAVNNATGTVAVGLQYGEILVLHNVGEYLRSFHNGNTGKDSFLTKTTMHWHAHGVLTLTFSDDGKYLYSGGEESVLVAWNVTRLSKNFLPRLGAPLCHLVTSRDAAKAAKVLTTTLDNSVRLVNTANMEIEWFWQSAYFAQNKYNLSALYNGVTNANFRISLLKTLLPFRLTDQQSEKTWKCSIQVDPYSGNILTNGHPGQLQSFDLINGVVRKNIKVTHFNRVSRKDSSEHLYVPSIMQHVYDSSGKFLVTIDIRKGEEMSEQPGQQGEVSLKFWEYNTSTETYELSAQMENPHGCNAMITDVKITVVLPNKSDNHAVLNANHGSGDMMVLVATASDDGVVKVWRGNYHNTVDTDNVTHKTQARNHNNTSSSGSGNNTATTELQGLKIRWKCSYSFQYRNCPITAVAWSNDGSTLVVCHENLISFWDPISVTMKKSITTVGSMKVSSIQILEPRADSDVGGGCGDVYLVVTTSNSLTVYSLLSMKSLWSYHASEITSSAAAVDERFIAIIDNNQSMSSIQQEGWIAIATSRQEIIAPKTPAPAKSVPVVEEDSKKKKGSKGKGKKAVVEEEETVGATTGESEGESTVKNRPTKIVHNEILVFSPLSATPLSQTKVPARVISLQFLARKPLSSSSGNNSVSGLAGVTADSELFVVSAQTNETTSKGGKKVALVKNAVLPTLNANVIISGNLKLFAKKDQESNHSYSTAVVGRTQTNKSWLQELFPEHSKDLPKPSDIVRDFMKHLSQSCTASYHQPTTGNKKAKSEVMAKIDEAAKKDTANHLPTIKPSESTPEELDAITEVLQQKFIALLERTSNRKSAVVPTSAAKPITATVRTTTTPAKATRARAPSESEDESVMSETPGRQTRKSSRVSLSRVPPPAMEEEKTVTTSATATTAASEDEKESVPSRTRRTRQSIASSGAVESASESESESVQSEASKTPKRGKKTKAAVTPSMEPVPEELDEVVEEAPARKSTRKSKASEPEHVEPVAEEPEVSKTRSSRKRKPTEELEDSAAAIAAAAVSAEATERRSTRRKAAK